MRAADVAREAFALGWAKSTAKHGLALTERAKTACMAAMRVAEASPQQSAAPTLQLGQLEGVWAVIYARREAIEQLHGEALADVLAAIKDLDWSSVINQVQTYLLIDPTMSGKELAARVGRDVENLIGQQLPPDVNTAWRSVMTTALTDATAEGQTAALALIGDAADITIDWDIAATAARAALIDNQVIFDSASSWIEKQVHGLGYQLSQTIATMWQDGAETADIEAAIAELLGIDRSIAATIFDQAIGQALSVGSLATYSYADVQYADYITAGDRRVCAICGDAEDNGPYLLRECPQPPLHVRCRCTVAPSDYIPTSAALQLVRGYQDMEADAA
jgi:hypothetical protein